MRLWQMATGFLRGARDVSEVSGSPGPHASAENVVKATLDIRIVRADGSSEKYRVMPNGSLEFRGLLTHEEVRAIVDAQDEQRRKALEALRKDK